jgi:hypothetical protein
VIKDAHFNFVHGQEQGQTVQLSHYFMQAACSNSRSSILELLNETSDIVLKKRKCQGWFRLWERDEPAAAPAAAAAPCAGSAEAVLYCCVGSATPAKPRSSPKQEQGLARS